MSKGKNGTVQMSSPYEFEGRIPLGQAIPLGLQHVLAMFVGNLTPLLVIIAACGAEEFAAVQVPVPVLSVYSAALQA